MARRRRRSAQNTPDLDTARVADELAARIRAELATFTTSDEAFADGLRMVLDRLHDDERASVVLATFDRLDPDRQVALLRELLGDKAVGRLIVGGLADRFASIRRFEVTDEILDRAVHGAHLDATEIPAGVTLTIGLFRPEDVHRGRELGEASDSCARELVVVATDDPGVFRVIVDRYHPRGGTQVSPDYDSSVWATEELASHTLVTFPDAELLAGARLDLSFDGATRSGRLHVGFVLIDGVEAFEPSRP